MMSTEPCHIPKPDRPLEPEFDAELARTQFDERMVMIRLLARRSNKEFGEYLCRTMLEQVRFLSRKHGLNFDR